MGPSALGRGVTLASAVRILTAALDCHSGNYAVSVIDLVEHAPTAHANPPTLQPTELPASRRTRVVFELKDSTGKAAEVGFGDTIELPTDPAV
jgi:hypothetical protein